MLPEAAAAAAAIVEEEEGRIFLPCALSAKAGSGEEDEVGLARDDDLEAGDGC